MTNGMRGGNDSYNWEMGEQIDSHILGRMEAEFMVTDDIIQEEEGPTQEAMDASVPLYQYQQELLTWLYGSVNRALNKEVSNTTEPKVFKMVPCQE